MPCPLAALAHPRVCVPLQTIARHEGVRGLYRGLSAAYGLQFSVTAVRAPKPYSLPSSTPHHTAPRASH